MAKTTKKNTKKATKSAAKKTTKKASKTAKKSQHGVERDHDLPWNEKKVAIFRALKKLRATGVTSAVSAVVVAEQAQMTAKDVRHYCYHAKAAGLTGVAEVEGTRGYAFHLTSKGAKIDPAKAAKAEQTAKNAK